MVSLAFRPRQPKAMAVVLLSFFTYGLGYFVGRLQGNAPLGTVPVSTMLRCDRGKLAGDDPINASVHGREYGNGWHSIDVFYGRSDHLEDTLPLDAEWFSQVRQDELVAKLLHGKRNGFFVDLAASDARVLSNTYSLERKFGWTGLCIEPNPIVWANHAYRDCQMVAAVVGKERMEDVRFRFDDGDLGGIAADGFDHGEQGKEQSDRKYTVTLKEILQRFNAPKHIDYLSLDVEGAESFVLNEFPFTDYVASLMMIERPTDDLKALLGRNGYKFLKLLSSWGETLWAHESMMDSMDLLSLAEFTGMQGTQSPIRNLTESPIPSPTEPPTPNPIESSTPNSTGGTHKLRYNWEALPPHSEVAKRLRDLQSNCSLAVGAYSWRGEFSGMGSDIHAWSNQLWVAMLESYRLKAPYPWLWTDEQVCGMNSSWLCYFPESVSTCPDEIVLPPLEPANDCGAPHENADVAALTDFRASATEFLFSSVSEVVIREAERQLQAVFGDKGVPINLITVHMRWGDKVEEGAATVVSDFIAAVETIVKEKDLDSVRILLCTEDPIAVEQFRAAAHPSWTIYIDHFYTEYLPFRMNGTVVYNGLSYIAADLKGKPGLWALGSLLVAMEANYFVLTTISNWSRLMNELRKNVVNPRCGNCTHMIDLQGGGEC